MFVIIVSGVLQCFGTIKNITLNYNVSDFSIETEDGLSHIVSDTHELSFGSDTTKPALPYIGVNVLVASTEEYVSHTATSSEVLTAENILLASNEKLLINNSTDSIETNIPQYDSLIYPSQCVVYTGTHIMDGYKFLSFMVCPFIYETFGNKLFFCSQINLNITIGISSGNPSYIGGNMRKIVRDIVQIDELNTLYPIPTNSNLSSSQISDYPIEYLIITNNECKSQFQRLCDWKTMKGIRTKVITVEEIYANPSYNDNSNPLKIKRAIKDYYRGTYSGLKYVLLGGDINILNAQYCNIVNDEQESSAITDYFFACLKDLNWDVNNNGKAGEEADHINIVPDVHIGRLPVRTSEQAEQIITRIINYEKGIGFSQWSKRILMAGVKAKKKYWPTGKSDSHYKGDWLYRRYIEDEWNGQLMKFYDTGTSFVGYDNYDVTYGHLKDQLEEGYPFVNMITHGENNYWKLEGNNTYSCANISNIFPYSIIASNSCKSCQLQFQCLGRSFLTEGGALAYLGYSDNSWGSTSRFHLGMSLKLIGRFFEDLFQKGGAHIGEALTNAKAKYIASDSYIDDFRWHLFTLNLIGDPEMPVFLNMPLSFNNVEASFNNGILHINTGVSNCNICVMDIDNDGASYYLVKKNIQTIDIEPNNAECKICVTKLGYKPYILNIPNTTYVQNQVFTGSQSITSGITHIGRDVTTTHQQGPVIVQSGTLTINSPKKVYIKNSFKVESGAKLRINP